MVEKIVTTLLFCISLLPAAYLRYYPFRSIASPMAKRVLLCGHIYIFLFEFVVYSALFTHNMMEFISGSYQWLYLFSFLPYFLLLIFTIRPYWFRHLFVAGIQSMYMLLVHTVTMEIYKLCWPEFWEQNEILPYYLIYIPLFLVGMPFMERLLGGLFTRELLSRRPAFWTYLGPVPLLLTYYHGNMGYFNLDPQEMFMPAIHLYSLVSRAVLALVGLCLIQAVKSGVQQVKLMFKIKERTIQLQDQLTELNEYASSLREEQQKMSILRHDSRHQLRLVAELVENGHFDEAEQQLLRVQKEVGSR